MFRHVARGVGAFVIFALIVLVGIMGKGNGIARAQSTADTSGSTQTEAYRASLQAQLDAINAQILQQQTILTQAEAQSSSLQQAITVLNAQIASAKLAIQARDLTIQQLTGNITEKQDTIFGLNTQLNAEKDSLAGILREKYQLENTSLIVTMFSADSLSTFFSDLDSFDSINNGLQQSFTEISSTTVATQAQKDALEAQLEQESQLRQVQALQEQQVEARQTQENKLLAQTKGQEKSYQALITSNQKTAAQLRTALFSLTGSAAIPFGKALDYANLAAQQTGIRPAFLLGIIAEESDLGENVGTGSYSVDMNPTRDVPIFKAITASLGLNPDTMPVSKKAWYGWGGAMGPAQFIPSTWAMYAGYVKPDWHYDSGKDRVGKLTGDTPPNPWDPKDALMASALYLTDSGADAKTPAAEFKAAMCYLAGCGNVGDKSLQFYGNQVLCNELKYQQDIDTITGSNDAAAMQSNSLYYGQC
jgi:peptidoglycan hydrolase CwlO-like protein